MNIQEVIDKHFPLEGTEGYKSTNERFAMFLENTYRYLGCCDGHTDKMAELIKDLKEE